MSLSLVIGDRDFSVWPLRVWLALKEAGIPFREEQVMLRRGDAAAQLKAKSPTGRIPVLVDDGITVWDSLAICEYVAERFPEKKLWPADAAARAMARSMCAEMHSGFQALRTACSFQITLETKGFIAPPDALKHLARIESMWREARTLCGQGGPFLFGHFTIADAFFAPVCGRILIYKLPVSRETNAYVDMIWARPAMQEWIAGARREVGLAA